MTKKFKYKGSADYSLINVPNVGYIEEKLYKKDVFYTTKEPNEVFVNYLGLELRCEKYKSTFSFKFMLYQYLKSSYTQ